MTKKYYLAYGSNLNIEQMKSRCPTAKAIGTAEIPGYELFFKGSKTGSYLTIEKKAGGKVPVAVWAVTANDEARLDAYEGYPTFYYKKKFRVAVTSLTGRKLGVKSCFAYIMDENRKLGVPTLGYLNTCFEGYENFGFDKSVLKRAYADSKGV